MDPLVRRGEDSSTMAYTFDIQRLYHIAYLSERNGGVDQARTQAALEDIATISTTYAGKSRSYGSIT
jgi:hypothetical protein